MKRSGSGSKSYNNCLRLYPSSPWEILPEENITLTVNFIRKTVENDQKYSVKILTLVTSTFLNFFEFVFS